MTLTCHMEFDVPDGRKMTDPDIRLLMTLLNSWPSLTSMRFFPFESSHRWTFELVDGRKWKEDWVMNGTADPTVISHANEGFRESDLNDKNLVKKQILLCMQNGGLSAMRVSLT